MAKTFSIAEITPAQYVNRIGSIYLEQGDPERAEGQMQYMRNQFGYYGLKAAEWVDILKTTFRNEGVYDPPELYKFVRLCYTQDYREMHYTGLQMLEKQLKVLPEDAILFLEECACTQSWWDSVDWLAKLIGKHFKRYPHLQRPTAERWMATENIWLKRLAIIHQLLYREQTDADLLFDMVLKIVGTKEFFLQKGAGWALRNYSKTSGPSVVRFIQAHPELPALTKREGLRWLKKYR